MSLRVFYTMHALLKLSGLTTQQLAFERKACFRDMVVFDYPVHMMESFVHDVVAHHNSPFVRSVVSKLSSDAPK